MQRALMRQRGFSLLELAVALVVMGLLLGSALTPLQAQWRARQWRETDALLATARAALLGHALQHGRLPCPARLDATGAAAGIEARIGGACQRDDGALPWATLGLPADDAWGRVLRYAVSPGFADDDPATPRAIAGCVAPPASGNASFNWCARGALEIDDAADGTPLARHVVAVVLSHGLNGAGGYDRHGRPGAPAQGAEAANTDGDQHFVAGRALGDGFDDQLVWLSPFPLHEALLRARRLP
ncbi:type II secretion system protein [Chitiniphilus shinanonensis]|uniref:type II secretion system protein n=2 Tax=Chitiniphilus shinanonensis TaxID=553088 RepID=UPI00306BAE58